MIPVWWANCSLVLVLVLSQLLTWASPPFWLRAAPSSVAVVQGSDGRLYEYGEQAQWSASSVDTQRLSVNESTLVLDNDEGRIVAVAVVSSGGGADVYVYRRKAK